MPEIPLLDTSVVRTLIALGGDEPGFVAEMVGDFADSVRRHTRAMRVAVQHADAAALMAAAHALQGSCGIIGARRMAETSRAIEENARAAGGGHRTLPLILRLESEYRAVRAALDATINEAPASLPR
jgi:HPt (histidine-containing phosphotransfer) domain-containing protein